MHSFSWKFLFAFFHETIKVENDFCGAGDNKYACFKNSCSLTLILKPRTSEFFFSYCQTMEKLWDRNSNLIPNTGSSVFLLELERRHLTF